MGGMYPQSKMKRLRWRSREISVACTEVGKVTYTELRRSEQRGQLLSTVSFRMDRRKSLMLGLGSQAKVSGGGGLLGEQ